MSRPAVFISYSHKDEIWKDRLKPQLDALEMAEQIEVWDDRDIDGGDKWYPELEEAMSKAAVAVCLISEHYLSSPFCVKEEIPFLLDREQENNMLFLPVLISPCPWKAFRWLKETQMLPRDGKSIIKDYRNNWSVAFVEVSNLILKKVTDPNYQPPTPAIKWAVPEKIDIGRLPETGAQLFGREKELRKLDEAWESTETNIISFIAWGGVGKSTLVNKWLEYMKVENYKGAERIFAWSFYSQGTNEQVSSADSFISEALSWFGDPDPTAGSAWDKGKRLAELIRQKKTLLILDGMEPLQSAHKFERGKIKDRGLASLLRSLARNNNGLCIISSRETVTDIAKYKQKVQQFDLEKLSAIAGRTLLRVGGVRGTDKELEAGVKEFGYHALAIKLLPVYLGHIEGHHISEAFEIPDPDIPEEKGRHPRRVIEALSARFVDQPEGDLLKMLGFFDRPADMAAVKKIMAPPAIEGLTENLNNKGEAVLLRAINNLRYEGLLAKESKHRPNTLDCHPLIREHFGEKLHKENRKAWREAHARLYEYYKSKPEKEYPDTLEEMEPLFAAVMHGCLASQYNKTEYEVYWKRIKRGNDKYIYHKLGAFGADLFCLSNFFESFWDKPYSCFTKKVKAFLFNEVGYALRAEGRLFDSIQPMKLGLEILVNEENWKNAAASASNLGELYLTHGNIKSATEYIELSEMFAKRSGSDHWIGTSQCKNADVLHNAGKFNDAEILFIEAEKMLIQKQPIYSYLFSVRGFQFCDLILSKGKVSEALLRAKTTIENAKREQKLLDIALDNLTIGKALMLEVVEKKSSDPSISVEAGLVEAEDYLNQAVDGLRASGYQDDLPRGLLARAELFRHQKDFRKAWEDLDEVHEIAEYGQMKLHMADYHLEACRVISDQLRVKSGESPAYAKASAGKGVDGEELGVGYRVVEDGEVLELTRVEMEERFRRHFEEAERLIRETGYRRRDGELMGLMV